MQDLFWAHVWNLVREAGGQQQIVLLLLDDLVPLCRGLEESLLGLTQLGLVLAMLFIVSPGLGSQTLSLIKDNSSNKSLFRW